MPETTCAKGSLAKNGLCMSLWTAGLYNEVLDRGINETAKFQLVNAFDVAAGADRFLSDAEAGLVATAVAMFKSSAAGTVTRNGLYNISDPQIEVEATQALELLRNAGSPSKRPACRAEKGPPAASDSDFLMASYLYYGVPDKDDLFWENVDKGCICSLQFMKDNIRTSDLRWTGRWLSMAFPKYWETKDPSRVLIDGIWMSPQVAELRQDKLLTENPPSIKNLVDRIFKEAATVSPYDRVYELSDDEAGLAVALLSMEMVRRDMDTSKFIQYEAASRVLSQLRDIVSIFNAIPHNTDVKCRISADGSALDIGASYYSFETMKNEFDINFTVRFDHTIDPDMMKDTDDFISHQASNLLYANSDGLVRDYTRAFTALKILTLASEKFGDYPSYGASISERTAEPPDARTLLERTGQKLKRDYPKFWK